MFLNKLQMMLIASFVVWLQNGIHSALLFASMWIIVVVTLRLVVHLLDEPRTAKKTHRGVWINGEYHLHGTYRLNDGMVRCGENGSVTVKGNRNVGNTITSG